MVDCTSEVGVGTEGAIVVGGALMEESPVGGGALVATSVPWSAVVLGLEIASSVFLGLAGVKVVMGCC